MNNFKRPNRPDLDATKTPTALEIAWAAGVYEGEGTCRLSGGNKKTGKIGRGLDISLPQKDPELLYWLRDWFGGSVWIPKKGKSCPRWQACGDRGRIFLALIYKFLTARRKQQIDVTGALDFLGSIPFSEMSIEQLRDRLTSYYGEHDKTTQYGNPELARSHGRDRYKSKVSSDPTFLEREKIRSQEYRASWTPERKARSSRYQRNYYQKKKQKLQLVEMQKSA